MFTKLVRQSRMVGLAFVLAAAVLVIVAWWEIGNLDVTHLQAQSNPNTAASQIAYLIGQGNTVTVWFNNPIFANRTTFSIVLSQKFNDVNFEFISASADSVCFTSNEDPKTSKECVPTSNISYFFWVGGSKTN